MLSWRRDKKEEPVRPAVGKPGASGSPASASAVGSAGTSSGSAPKLSLGECLVQEGIITQGQLEEARAKQKETGGFLGQVLIDLKSITQPALVSFLVKQCKIPHISLLDYDVSEDLFKLVPKELCRTHYLLPIDKLGSILTLAMVDPLDAAALEKVRQACPDLKIKPILCDWNHYEAVARKLFSDPGKNVQEVSASSFGLAERRIAPKKEATVATTQAAVDAAVTAIVQEASGHAAAAGRAPAGAAQPPVATAAAPRIAPSAGVNVEELAAQLREPIRGALQDALAPVVQAQQRLVSAYTAESHRQAAVMPDPKVWLGQVSEGIRAAMQDARLSALNAQARDGGASIPDSKWLKELAEEIRGAVQEAVAPVAEALSRAKQPSVVPVVGDAKALKALTEGVRGAVQEALSPVVAALAKTGQTTPSRDADKLAASLAASLEQGLEALSQEIRAALATRHSVPSGIESAEIVDRLVAAIQLAMSSQESTIQQLAEAAARAAEAAESAVKEARRPEKGKSPARAANVEAFPAPRGGEAAVVSTVLGEVDLAAAAEVLEISGLGLEADERVRASLESDHLLEGYTFDGFLSGPGNAFTVKAARSLAERPTRDLTPMYIYGGVGMGKTHLLNAIGNGLHAFNPDLRIGILSGSHFDSSLRSARETGKLDEFRRRFCHWDALLFDDIQFLSERAEAQEELFHIFNALQHEGRLLILTSDCAPDRLEGFDPGLVSRFSSGIVTRLRAPEMEVRVAILKLQAARQRAAVPEEILRLIAARIPSDIRKLVGALHRVVAFTKLVGPEITAEVANEILNDLGAIEAA